ncbi:acireductone dioxygenase [bacterium]|nr:acireductone dioxygenase [bacterium]MCI0603102.1 acireductone dioxygenase [bacterium]
MSLLKLFEEDNSKDCQEFTVFEEIAAKLREVRIHFERWTADRELTKDSTQEEILAAYDRPVRELMERCGFVTADVISVHPEMPNHPELRKKFLEEHTHSEDEARFFVDGCGLFYIHTNERVYAVLCERGDFIDVPAHTRHWFDMGPRPLLKAIRTFTTPEGWVADFTGSDIASRFPRFETLIAVPA